MNAPTEYFRDSLASQVVDYLEALYEGASGEYSVPSIVEELLVEGIYELDDLDPGYLPELIEQHW